MGCAIQPAAGAARRLLPPLLLLLQLARAEAGDAVVINTWPFTSATDAAWEVLKAGGPHAALNAVERGCSECERLGCDGTVGAGGSPDEEGEVSLDALIMDGTTFEVGAVASLRHVKDAIAAARLVMERTQHSMLAGLQASAFALEMGLKPANLSSADSMREYRKWKAHHCQPNFRRRVVPDPTRHCGPYSLPNAAREWEAGLEGGARAGGARAGGDAGAADQGAPLAQAHSGGGGAGASERGAGGSAGGAAGCEGSTGGCSEPGSRSSSGDGGSSGSQSDGGGGASSGGADALRGSGGGGQQAARRPAVDDRHHDTIAMIALDSHGHIAAGASTNGASHKIPGRVGDAAVAGAGAYADSSVGGCGATGDGDIHLRFLPCLLVVEAMRSGASPTAAAEQALRRMASVYPGLRSGLVALDAQGNHGAAAVNWRFSYSVRDGSSHSARVIEVEPLQLLPQVAAGAREGRARGGGGGAVQLGQQDLRAV